MEQDVRIAVIGLGYVGMPIVLSFARYLNIIAYDISYNKICYLKSKYSSNSKIYFTNNESDLKKANFFIVCVPTPIYNDKKPDLSYLKNSCKIIGRNLSENAVVVFESTVFPGVTEEVCIPLLEKYSNFIYKKQFNVGYSPERINVGDNNHNFINTTKIVAANDKKTLKIISMVYNLVLNNVYEVCDIKTAEAAKIIENCQRDVNIAFMNEFSIILNKLNVNMEEVLKAAKTKWNFLNFSPGLVGGHCIGIDPYYMIYKANDLGYNPKILSQSRFINESMSEYIVNNIIKIIFKEQLTIKELNVGIFGFTFKENCDDVRNTKVYDIILHLNNYNINPKVYDPNANFKITKDLYNIELINKKELKNLDIIIFAVSHNEFKNISINQLNKMFKTNVKIVIDLKWIFDEKKLLDNGFVYWRL